MAWLPLGLRSNSNRGLYKFNEEQVQMLTISTELSGIALGDAAAVETMLAETDLPAGVTWAIGGAIKDQRESFGDMGLLMGMGLFLVYLYGR